MTNFSNLPHEKLHAYQEARSLLMCVHQAKIADGKLRDQALRAARSICLNIAEGAGRSSVPDKARVYSIARGETCEVVAAPEIALLTRLTGLIRRSGGSPSPLLLVRSRRK